MNNKTIEDMIASGELGTMTECAYGSTIADTESENVINKVTKDAKNNTNKNTNIK